MLVVDHLFALKPANNLDDGHPFFLKSSTQHNIASTNMADAKGPRIFQRDDISYWPHITGCIPV
jgi:hypothetical protein